MLHAVRKAMQSTVLGYVHYSTVATTKLSKITCYCQLHQLAIYMREVARPTLKYIDIYIYI